MYTTAYNFVINGLFIFEKTYLFRQLSWIIFFIYVARTTGIGKAEQFLFGSVTDKVARHSTCAVTIVK